MSFSTADIQYLEDGMTAMYLGLPRMLVCCYLVHVFASSILPKTMRLMVAMGFSLPAMAGVWSELGSLPTDVPMAALVCKEFILGFLLGFSLCMPFWALEAVGALYDNGRGANTAQQVTPFATADLSQSGAILRLSIIAYLSATGAIMLLYELIMMSFEAWPVLQLVPDLHGFGPDEMIARFSEFTKMAVLYAGPIIAVIGLIDLAFALVGVFSPQLPTYFAAMPVKSIVGLMILVLYITILLEHGSNYFQRVVSFDDSSFRTIIDKRER